MLVALENQHLIRLKSLLVSKFFVYGILCSVIIYAVITIKNDLYITKYSLSDTNVSGVIKDIDKKDNLLKITIDEVIINYYATEQEINQFNLGDYISAYGILSSPQEEQNFNLFNYRNYLLSKKIYYVMSAENLEKINYRISLWYKIKKFVISLMHDKLSEEYLQAFILGDVSYIDDEVLKSYQNLGIIHLFSISGMHVALITYLFMNILKKIRLKKFLTYLFIMGFMMIYIFITGFSVSMIRATFLFILCSINRELKLKISTETLLIYIFCAAIIWNPFYLYNTGFLFSYVVSFFLIKFRLLINHKNYFVNSLYTSLLAFIVTVPIIINNNFSINIFTPIYNLLFIPLITYISFPLSLITLIFPCFDGIFLLVMNFIEFLSITLANLNIGNITLCHLSLPVFLIYYIAIIFVFNKIARKKYLYSIILIIIIIIHHNIRLFDRNISITYLNVGQGDSILIILPHNKGNILIDCAGKVNSDSANNKYNISENIIIPFLKSKGITKLDYMISTHGDFDHMGEAINLVNNFKVDKVIFNCGSYNELEKKLIKVLDKKHIKYYSCIKELNIDNNKLYFLQTKEYDNENDNSNVISTELDGYKFMFMGDASSVTEKEIMSIYNLPDIDVLKVGHHGSKTSSGKEFIDEINPKYSIISVGKNNRYGHPNKEVLDNLDNSRIYRTDQDGSIMFKIKNNKLKIETCSP